MPLGKSWYSGRRRLSLQGVPHELLEYMRASVSRSGPSALPRPMLPSVTLWLEGLEGGEQHTCMQ